MNNNELKTRKAKIDYILDYGNDNTCTIYSVYDLAYRLDVDLDFITERIKDI